MTIAPTGTAVSPGTRVDRRYRLDGMRASGSGWSLWRGTDELLERSIAIHVFEPDRVRSSEVFDAVRRASRLTHGGLARVFDADEDGAPPYLVSEWVGGRDLAGVLARGPLEPHRAAEVFRQVSVALAVAHDAGVGHLRLGLRSVAWSRSGHVKIVGLGVEAAVAGIRVDDPDAADTRALGRLMWTALSGRAAPQAEALRPRPAAVLRAWLACHGGVGRELASIAHRALGDGGSPIRSMAGFADELRRVAPDLRSAVDRGIGVSEPIPGLARVRTRIDGLAVSTQPIQPVPMTPERRGIAA